MPSIVKVDCLGTSTVGGFGLPCLGCGYMHTDTAVKAVLGNYYQLVLFYLFFGCIVRPYCIEISSVYRAVGKGNRKCRAPSKEVSVMILAPSRHCISIPFLHQHTSTSQPWPHLQFIPQRLRYPRCAFEAPGYCGHLCRLCLASHGAGCPHFGQAHSQRQPW